MNKIWLQKMNRKKNSYYIQLLLFMLFIGVTSAVLVGTFSYTYAVNIVQQNLERENNQLLLQVKTDIEYNLREIDRLALTLARSEPLQQAMRKKVTATDFQMVVQLSRMLEQICTEQLLLSEKSLVQISHDWVINRLGLHQNAESDELYRRLKDKLGTVSGFAGWILEKPEDQSEALMIYARKLPLFVNEPNGWILVSYNGSDVIKMLSKYQHVGNMMLIGTDGTIVAEELRVGKPALSVDKGWQDAVDTLCTQARKDNKGVITVELENTQWRLQYSFSDTSELIYVNAVSIQETKEALSSIKLFTLSTCLVIIGICILVALSGTDRLYRPILRLYRQAVLDDDNLEVHKKNELDHIHAMFNKLRQDKQMLSQEIILQTADLDEYALVRMFENSLNSGEFQEICRRFENQYARYVVILFQLDRFYGRIFDANDRDIAFYAVSNVIRELTTDCDQVAVFKIKEYYGLIISPDSSVIEEKQKLFDLCSGIQKSLLTLLDVSVSIGLSDISPVAAELPILFEQAKKALSYRLLTDTHIILNFSDIPSLPSKPSMQIQITNENIMNAIRLGDKEEALIYLHNLSYEVLEDTIDVSYHQDAYFGLIMQIAYLLMDYKDFNPSCGFNVQELLLEFTHLKTKESIFLWFSNSVIGPAIAMLENAKDNNDTLVVKKMMAIIEQYGVGTTIEECSVKLNYTANHLGQIFTRVVGKTFSDYMTERKIQLAKTILLQTDTQVAQIAQDLGYSNTQNFIRAFKKIIGQTPQKFRDENRT